MPLVPYGFGLSYTDFKIYDAEFSIKNDEVQGSCRIKNKGNRIESSHS